MDNTGEPFGLPSGTVRGTIALAFTAALIYMGVTAMVTPDVLIAIAGPAVGFYFANRQTGDMIKAATPVEPKIDPPATGDHPAQADDVLTPQ